MRPLRLTVDAGQEYSFTAFPEDLHTGDLAHLAENSVRASLSIIDMQSRDDAIFRASLMVSDWILQSLLKDEKTPVFIRNLILFLGTYLNGGWEYAYDQSGFTTTPFLRANGHPHQPNKKALMRMFSEPMLVSNEVEATTQEELFSKLKLPPLSTNTCFVTGIDAEDGMAIAVDLPALTLEGEATYRLSKVGRDILEFRHRDSPMLTCVLTGHRFRSDLSFLNPHAGAAYCPLPMYPPVAMALRRRYVNEQLDVASWLACLHAPFLVPAVSL
jgi:hypothetical protein